MVKLFIGILKGAVVGGAVGYGAYALNLHGGMDWVTYGAIGALVGLLVGRPLWSLIVDKNATTFVSILKAMAGFGVGCGLYALVSRVWGGFPLTLGGETRMIYDWQPVLGAAIGGVYGGFVELDDAIGDDAKGKSGKKAIAAAPAKKLPPG